MEIKGRVLLHLPLKSGISKDKEWKSQDFIVETYDPKYPKKLCFNLYGDKISMLPLIGDDVTVQFECESRDYKGNWFTSLRVWKIESSSIKSEPMQQQSISEENGDPFPF